MESQKDDSLLVEGEMTDRQGQAYMQKVGSVVYPFMSMGGYLVPV